MPIPKKLYQTWKVKSLSNEMMMLVNSWKTNNPEYEQVLYDDTECASFIKDNFSSDVYDAYMRILPGAYKADLWRYCVLYVNGGVYADIDTICLGSIDTFLSVGVEFMVPIDLNVSENEGQYNLFNTFIASAPKSPILLNCINEIVESIQNDRIPESKLDFSGPGVLGRSMNRFLGLPEKSSFVGKEGLIMDGRISLLKFERYSEYVSDLGQNRLFQNKCGNREIMNIYQEECRRVGTLNWVTATNILLPKKGIAKIFFQKSREALPIRFTEMIKHNLTAGWSYYNYINGDELQFFIDNPHPEFPDIVAKFNEIKRGEHKADLFRYYHLFVKGGVYIDSDAMIYEPIDSIVKDYTFFAVDSWLPNSISNCVVASEKGNPIIYAALKQMYTMDYSVLDSDFQYVCKSLYSIYNGYQGDKSKFVLFKEVSNEGGDRIIDSTGKVLFKHFWKNKENFPNHLLSLPKLKSKNLVYACVFYNKDYFKLLELLVTSIKFFSSTDSFDLLVMTNPDFEQSVHEICTKYSINIHIMKCDFKTIFQAACARLHIFNYEYISHYERILYIDTDIIIKAELAPIFDLKIANKLYGIESGYISSPAFGVQFFNFNDSSLNLNHGMTGINSGTLLFNNCLEIRDLFSRIRGHLRAFTDSGTAPPYTMDQPFINYHAITDGLYDNKLLNPYVSLYEGSDEVTNYATSIICHFSFPIGNFGHKHFRMKEFLINILEHSEKKGCEYDNPLNGRTYFWGNSTNVITFKDTYLATPWKNGNYEYRATHKVCAHWNHHYHILKFADDYSSYISARVYPRDVDYNFTDCTIRDKIRVLDVKYNLIEDRSYDSKSVCFIHSCHLAERGTEKLDLVLNAAIGIEELDTIFINNIGLPLDSTKYNSLDTRIKIIQCSDDPNLFELPTLKLISQFSKNNKNTKLLYLHSKGISYNKSDGRTLTILDWINYMLYFLCKKSKMCIELLNEYDTLGCDLLEKDVALHYSGNFWWATTKYLSTLEVSRLTNKYSAEWWVLSGNSKGYTLHDSKRTGGQHYMYRYPESEYID